jgi:hypothetical protein
MARLEQLSHACTEALRDAEAHGAKVAAHFLRVQVRELFRECAHHAHDIAQAETEPLIRKNRDHG